MNTVLILFFSLLSLAVGRDGDRCFVENEITVDRFRCNFFTRCINGETKAFKCPDGYIVNTQATDLSDICTLGQCTNPQPPTVGPPTSAPTYGVDNDVVYESCSRGKLQFDQYDCTRYWECNNYGRFESRKCRNGYFFDFLQRQCVRGENCKATSYCPEGEFQPLEKCGEYQVCYKQQFVSGKCRDNTVFFDGKCLNKQCPAPRPPVRPPQCRTGAIAPHKTDKRSYYFCYYGRWEQRFCAVNMIFNYKTFRCEREQENYPPPHPECYNGQTRSFDKNCQLYELCVYGKWVLKACPYNMIYEDNYCVIGQCPVPQPTKCHESAGIDGYRRDPQDCTKYYQCVHDAWMLRPCGAGTVFNERIAVCDWPANVPECGGY